MTRLRHLFLLLFFVAITVSCSKKNNPSAYHSDTTRVTSRIKVDPEVIDLIRPYKDQLDAQMDEVIGVFAHDMHKGQKPEGELGNFMSDAPLEYLKEIQPELKDVDFGLTNHGGIRSQLIPAGEVTVEQIFELMPFENEMVVIEVGGNVLKDMMSTIAASGGWPISSNVNLLISEGKVDTFLINGEVVDWEKPLKVLTTDYVANGGSGMDMLEGIPVEKTGVLMRDALIEYIRWKTKMRETISDPINGRVIIVGGKEESTTE